MASAVPGSAARKNTQPIVTHTSVSPHPAGRPMPVGAIRQRPHAARQP